MAFNYITTIFVIPQRHTALKHIEKKNNNLGHTNLVIHNEL